MTFTILTSGGIVWSAAFRGRSLTLCSCPIGWTSGGQKSINKLALESDILFLAEKKNCWENNELQYDMTVAYIYNTLWFNLAMKCFDPTKTKHHLEREYYVYTCYVGCEFTCLILKSNQRMTSGQQVVISFVFQWDPMGWCMTLVRGSDI